MQYAGFSLSRLLKTAIVRKARTVGHVLFTDQYLVFTNIGISFTSSGLGDFLEQQFKILQGENEKWDKVRTKNMSLSGITIGLLTHHSYRYLDYYFPGRTLGMLVRKILCDQLLVSPVAITVCLTSLAVLEQSTLQTLRDELIHKGWRLYLAEWVVWPPAQIINFYFLPLRFRVLYDNTISLGYDIYTSHIKHNVLIPKPKTLEENK